MKLKLYKPIHPFVVTQYFGKDKTDPAYLATYQKMRLQGHNGWDCVRPPPYETESCAVRASHDGEVMYAGIDACFGYGIVLKTLEQFDYEQKQCYFKTIYWHVEPKIPVKIGQKVKAGDVIAFASHTGCNIKPHLHWGLKPIYQGESEWTWYNLVPDNGYMGAIDLEPYVSSLTAYELLNPASEFIPIKSETLIIPAIATMTPEFEESIKIQKISIIQKLISLYQKLIDLFIENRTFGATRSSQWPKVRRQHILKNPSCAICQSYDTIEVHHIKPFHLDPKLELEPTNLVTLCESKKNGVTCHQFFGHLGSYRSYNHSIKQDAEYWNLKIKERP